MHEMRTAMGLFDRFKTSQTRTDIAPLESVVRAEPGRMRLVPDVDDETSHFERSVREHLERLTAAADCDIASLSTEEFDAALTSRLVGAERIQSTELGFSYASHFAEHIHEVLTLDLPTAVVTLPDSRIADTGRRVPSLVNKGRNNLLDLLETTSVDVQRVGEGNRGVYAVMGDSPYTASFARFLNDAAHRWLPDVDDRNGFVFAVPYRHAILLQPCSTPAEIRDALDLVPEYAQRLHAEGVSPVSVHAYHWLGRQITCLTTEEDDGTITVQPTEVLEQLMGLGRRAG
jgi:hypothetical protein